MAFVTKAGVSLGLAKKVQMLYPGWGAAFATLVVAVVVLNQLIGPVLMRVVLRRVGEARLSGGQPVLGARHEVVVMDGTAQVPSIS